MGAPKRQLTSGAIVKAVGMHFDVGAGEILGKSKSQRIVRARRWSMFIARLKLGWSYPELGRSFGRSHVAVLQACQIAAREFLTDKARRAEVQSICRSLGVGLVMVQGELFELAKGGK